MAIYESDHCVVDSYTPDGRTPAWYIGDNYESYDSPDWPTKEAMIVDLEHALEALRST